MRLWALPWLLLLCVAQLTSAAQAQSSAASPAPVFWDAHPVWAADGKTIALERHYRDGPTVIASVGADGRNLRRLTEIQGAGVAWSPDGRTIAYQDTRRNGSAEIWLLSPDGSGRREFTGQHGTSPAWSPDGRAIAFADALGVIYVMNTDGRNVRPVSPHHCSNHTFAWSPHGREIAVQGDCGLFVVNANVPATEWAVGNGGKYRSLTRIGGFNGPFVWSPDGRTLVFSSERHAKRAGRYGRASELYVINADGTNLRRLTRYPDAIAEDTEPVWSRDGRTIVYRHESDYVESPRSCQEYDFICGYMKTELWAMDADGGNQRPLIKGAERADVYRAWSPDSRTIAFARDGRIYLMNADGSNQHRIT